MPENTLFFAKLWSSNSAISAPASSAPGTHTPKRKCTHTDERTHAHAHTHSRKVHKTQWAIANEFLFCFTNSCYRPLLVCAKIQSHAYKMFYNTHVSAHTNTNTLTHTHTHTHTRTRTHTHTHTHTFRLFLAQVLLDLFTALSFTQLLDLPLVQRLLLNTPACMSAYLGI
jgi:hypothetical protein